MISVLDIERLWRALRCAQGRWRSWSPPTFVGDLGTNVGAAGRLLGRGWGPATPGLVRPRLGDQADHRARRRCLARAKLDLGRARAILPELGGTKAGAASINSARIGPGLEGIDPSIARSRKGASWTGGALAGGCDGTGDTAGSIPDKGFARLQRSQVPLVRAIAQVWCALDQVLARESRALSAQDRVGGNTGCSASAPGGGDRVMPWRGRAIRASSRRERVGVVRRRCIGSPGSSGRPPACSRSDERWSTRHGRVGDF